jgi:hypothetical protein
MAALTFGQTPAKKETPPPVKKTAPPAAPDLWERSKECAAQAEKMIAAHDAEMVALLGAKHSDRWSNHYSPRYDRCFVESIYLPQAKDIVKGGPVTFTTLFDAFERSDLASTAVGLAPEIACRNEQNSEQCLEIARNIWKSSCRIDNQPTDCAKAKQFIAEHMKN